MLGMIRTCLVLSLAFAGAAVWASADKQPALPRFNHDLARPHEIKPHRHTIPMPGVGHGYNQLDLVLTVSATGQVTEAQPAGG